MTTYIILWCIQDKATFFLNFLPESNEIKQIFFSRFFLLQWQFKVDMRGNHTGLDLFISSKQVYFLHQQEHKMCFNWFVFHETAVQSAQQQRL